MSSQFSQLSGGAGKIDGEFVTFNASSSSALRSPAYFETTNPYFAKAIVNRLWKRMMGRGLVEPVDDFRATNPATHPVLLDKLAEDFVWGLMTCHEFVTNH